MYNIIYYNLQTYKNVWSSHTCGNNILITRMLIIYFTIHCAIQYLWYTILEVRKLIIRARFNQPKSCRPFLGNLKIFRIKHIFFLLLFNIFKYLNTWFLVTIFARRNYQQSAKTWYYCTFHLTIYLHEILLQCHINM